jgi:homoserine O-succinyltransferase
VAKATFSSRAGGGPTFAGAQPGLRIGLLNNMPDAALAATERQFSTLLQVASGTPVLLQLFALNGVARGPDAQAHMRGRYQGAEMLPEAGLDGLIVTGAEPRAASLEEEPYWPALTRVIDWSKTSGVPTIWSCLAAHAAVLHLSGIRRRPLDMKLSGVFECQPVRDDPLLDGASGALITPHSRQNGLAAIDLGDRGYRVLTQSAAVGVDAFVRRGSGLALFLQGHPEYDAETLMREYTRDVGRYLNGKRPHHPETPAHYFEPDVEAGLAELGDFARRRPRPDLAPLYTAILAKAAPSRTWRASSVRLYRNWLAEAARTRAAPSGRRREMA